MKNALVVLSSIVLSLGQLAYGAQAECVELPSDEGIDGDIILSLKPQLSDGQLLQVDFDEAMYCIVERDSAELDGQASTAMHVNTDLDELAISAAIDGVAIWLRVDNSFSDAMVLDRNTSEGFGLTEAEFLGDNSLLEASDFFVEFLDSVEFGEFVIDDVEVNIPRLDAPYDHYSGRGPLPTMTDPNVGFLTVGSVGEELLEDLLMTFDFSNNRIYTMQAR